MLCTAVQHIWFRKLNQQNQSAVHTLLWPSRILECKMWIFLCRFLWAHTEQFHPCADVLILWSLHHPFHAEILVVETLPHPSPAGQYITKQSLITVISKPPWNGNFRREGFYFPEFKCTLLFKCLTIFLKILSNFIQIKPFCWKKTKDTKV